PSGTRLEAWVAASRPPREIELVRRGTLQGIVRPVVIVPEKEQLQLVLECAAQQRHHGQDSGAAVLQSANETLDDRDASRPAHSAAPMLDAPATTPLPKLSELSATVSDQMLGRGANAGNYTTKELKHAFGCRLTPKKRTAKRTARKMINHDRQPPAERPALRQRKRQPCGPITGGGGHRGEVHVPDVIGSLGSDA